VNALVVGAGGLGCPAAWSLASRGAAMTIVDDDRVEVGNLHRQILHRTEDVGRHKAESAREALLRRWPGLKIVSVVARVGADNAAALVVGHDVVLDCTDSFASKFLLNDVCVAAGVPLVHGAVVGLSGQVLTVMPGAACYRCLFEAPPPPEAVAGCAQAGVLGPLCGVVGVTMAEEAQATLAGRPRLTGALEVIAVGGTRLVRLRPRADCAACGRAGFGSEQERRGA